MYPFPLWDHRPPPQDHPIPDPEDYEVEGIVDFSEAQEGEERSVEGVGPFEVDPKGEFDAAPSQAEYDALKKRRRRYGMESKVRWKSHAKW